MGAFSQRMLRTFIIPLLFAICECFPFVRKGSFDYTTMDKSQNEIDQHVLQDVRRDFKTFLSNSMQDNNIYRASTDQFNNKNTVATVGNVNKINERTNHLLDTLFNIESIDEKGTIPMPQIDSSLLTSIKEYLTKARLRNKDNKLANIYKKVIDKLSDHNKPIETSVQKSSPSVSIANADIRTKRRKTALSSSEVRKRRSYYGPDLDEIFADDEAGGIFGAHTSPCGYSDRHYCMNGGTCLYMPALRVKTCRCTTGYMGTRCESLNQEYLLALFAEEILG